MKKKEVGIKEKEHFERRERSNTKRAKVRKIHNDILEPSFTGKSLLANNNNPKYIQSTLISPVMFSFLENPNETLKFFDIFQKKATTNDSIIINMKKLTKDITIEVLLYIISLDKIYKSKNKKLHIKIKTPNDERINYLISKSGIMDYFQSNSDMGEDTDLIFKIKDSTHIDSKNIARNASDFLSKFNDNKKRILFTAISEMKLNTEQWAYRSESSLESWYIFGIRNEKHVDFYFFDNGEGIATTAKRNIKDIFSAKRILQDALNGKNRSNTELRYRNKGLPQIKTLLTDEDVLFSTIITNKIKVDFNKDSNNSEKYVKLDYNFRGTLFALAIKTQIKE